MLRNLLLLLIGVAIGYFMGFSDRSTHSKNVIERAVDRVGGSKPKSVDDMLDSVARSR